MADSRLLRGTFLLTAATFIAKFLGMISVFPLHALIGEQGGALYSYAYIPYSITLSIATLGIPLAVSKFVSKYNAIGDYETGRRLFRSGLKVMGLMGLLSFVALYMLAPWIAPLVINGDTFSADDVTYVIRMVSVALIIVPAMSLVRGFFQGYQSMGPSAASTAMEQLVRVIFMLVGAYIALFWFNSSLVTAVGVATFAAFIGAIGGLFTLVYFWKKRRLGSIKKSTSAAKVPLDEMYKELIRYAIPFVFVGLAVPLFQLVDMFTFNRTLAAANYEGDSNALFSAFTLYNHKLIMIPVSLATGFALNLIPTVTSAFTANKLKDVQRYMTQAFQVILFLITPASLGLSVLAESAYASFFDVNEQFDSYAQILRWYAPAALLYALYTVSTALLQGINRQKVAMLSLAIGFIIKCILNVPFLYWFDAIGSVLATMIGFSSAVFFNLYAIHRSTGYRFRQLVKRFILILVICSIMVIAVVLWSSALAVWFPIESSRLNAIIVLGSGVAIGALLYFLISLRIGLMEKVLGSQILKKLRLPTRGA
ncbi:polysaccharide biosynthesis protein [Bacillaceae bacterium SIJ1]|uniref:putative polysaccharide biosynthesis protein n=1 Tax=Litoribacterium kuwaitense TaxID=1398745 RepID=UPI0013EC4F76|nr:polysaccharide biosynthesis protein [Litoribacterium kuwaitense]NGP44218.1 polysaccharide biosynthesis protein [Litoribacterium kuwaitense]